jgi:hypothetical protein
MSLRVYEDYLEELFKRERRPSKEYMSQWIRTCLAQGGTPLFRTSWGPFKRVDTVFVVCFGGVGDEMSEVWEVDHDLWEKIRKSKNDLEVVLEYVDPKLLTELRERYNAELERLHEVVFEEVEKRNKK